MISDSSIQEIKDKADLVEVVKTFTDLKKKGANWVGCCPFHDEKTPSFAVSDVKGTYKCFGCGKYGNNAIGFIMDKQGMDYPTAVKYLADKYNVTLQHDKDNTETAEKQAQRADYLKINERVARMYHKNLLNQKCANWPVEPMNPVINELINVRKLTEETIIAFQIGFAPDEWRYITPVLLDNMLFKPAEELGLVKTKNDTNYDVYRNRIIFPIHNERGEICGFGGRKMPDNNEDNPKYLNSRDSLIYKKDTVLFGLYQAAAAIRKMKFANLVEGYFDVTGFYQTGLPNTVATCGTALTENHAKLLKKYTNHVVLFFDGDKAGMKASLRAIDILLMHGFKVDVGTLPKGEDPDSFSRTFEYSDEEELAA